MLCRDKYFVCARTLHADRIWATDSWAHILHLASASSVVLVFLELYSLVGGSCSYSSIIPAIVCVGAARHSVIQEKHSPSKFFVLPTNRHQLSLPLLFFSILKALTLYCFLCPHSNLSALYYLTLLHSTSRVRAPEF